MKQNVIKLDGSAAGEISLDKAIFGVDIRKDLLHRAVIWQRNAMQAGTGHTKHRADMTSISNKKIYRQKGTGGARHASKRANIFRGGAKQFGPRARDFSTELPKKVRALAIKTALSAKLAGKDLIVIDEAKTSTHKTKDLAAMLSKGNMARALFVVDSMDANFDKASRNIPHVKVIPTEGINVYDLLRHDKVVLTQAAVAMVSERLTQRSTKAVKEAK